MCRRLLGLQLLMTLVVTAACKSDEASYTPGYRREAPRNTAVEYSFGVHPLHNPRRMDELFGPVVEHLARVSGVSLRLEGSRSYAAFEEKLRQRTLDFALPNPYQTLIAVDHGYTVIGKMGDNGSFRGLVLVRRDGKVRSAVDLRGKQISFPAPTALAATILPQLWLFEQGLLPGRDYDAVFVGSQESSIMSVALGQTEAGATWPPPWKALSRDRPDLDQLLTPLWLGEPMPNNSVVARADLPADVVDRVRDRLLHLHEDAGGRALLARLELSRFEAATLETYAVVRPVIERYRREIGPIP